MNASQHKFAFLGFGFYRGIAVDSSIRKSIPVAGTPASDEKPENCPDADPDGDGLIRMLMHGCVSGFRAGNRLVTDIACNFLGAFQRGGETLARFPDFFAGHVSGGGHQRVRVLGQLSDVIPNCLCFFVHIFLFLFVGIIHGKFSSAVR
jgi:hypothetical protein